MFGLGFRVKLDDAQGLLLDFYLGITPDMLREPYRMPAVGVRSTYVTQTLYPLTCM